MAMQLESEEGDDNARHWARDSNSLRGPGLARNVPLHDLDRRLRFRSHGESLLLQAMLREDAGLYAPNNIYAVLHLARLAEDCLQDEVIRAYRLKVLAEKYLLVITSLPGENGASIGAAKTSMKARTESWERLLGALMAAKHYLTQLQPSENREQ